MEDQRMQGANVSTEFGQLLALRRELGGLLVPRKPGVEFRTALRASLVHDVRQQAAQVAILAEPALRTRAMPDLEYGLPRGRRWVFGAAAVGSAAAVSVAGALAYYFRHRSRRAA